MATDWTVEPTTGDGEAGPLCPAGTFPAVVVAIIDVGTHTQADITTGAPRDLRKLVVAYELGYQNPDGSPFVFAEKLTVSMHDRAILAARYTSIVSSIVPGVTPNLAALLGRQCSVGIAHTTGSKGDRVFANIESVSAPIHGMPPVAPRRQPFVWRMDGGTPLPDVTWVPKLFRDSVADLLAQSHERRGGQTQQPIPAQSYQPAPVQLRQQQPIPAQYQPPAMQGTTPVQQPVSQATAQARLQAEYEQRQRQAASMPVIPF